MDWKFIGYREASGGAVAEFVATMSKDELTGALQGGAMRPERIRRKGVECS